jgi:hypothetical protein
LPRLALGFLALVLVAIVAVEWSGRELTQRIAEDQLRDAVVAGGVEVTVGRSWWQPSVLPALLTGDVDRLEVQLRDAQLYSLPVAEADYVLEDLTIEVSIGDRTVRATSLGSGSVRVLVDPSAIAQALGTDARVVDGAVVLGPDRVPAELQIVGRNLVVTSPALDAAGGTTQFQVVDPQLLPCEPQVSVRGQLVELSCEGDDLPGVLERSIGTGGVSGAEPPTQLEPPATLEVPSTAPTDTTAPTETAPTEGGNDVGG